MNSLRAKIHEIIFEAETPAGKIFDIWLIVFVSLSVLTVMLESVEPLQQKYHFEFTLAEWFFTGIFSIEFLLRLFCVHRPSKYLFSFFGLVDFFSIMPTYLSLVFPGAQSLLVIRGLRLLRVFRVLKLSRYTVAGKVLYAALKQSQHKITVFLGVIVSLVLIVGAIMYLIEGKENGFTSIPTSVYWAVVTVTTVGYGDISPATPLGQFIASLLMIVGFGIIAVPTGIVSVELANVSRSREFTRACRHCTKEGHDFGAKFCSECGHALHESE